MRQTTPFRRRGLWEIKGRNFIFLHYCLPSWMTENTYSMPMPYKSVIEKIERPEKNNEDFHADCIIQGCKWWTSEIVIWDTACRKTWLDVVENAMTCWRPQRMPRSSSIMAWVSQTKGFEEEIRASPSDLDPHSCSDSNLSPPWLFRILLTEWPYIYLSFWPAKRWRQYIALTRGWQKD